MIRLFFAASFILTKKLSVENQSSSGTWPHIRHNHESTTLFDMRHSNFERIMVFNFVTLLAHYCPANNAPLFRTTAGPVELKMEEKVLHPPPLIRHRVYLMQE